jgi:hypothetical protein
MASGVSSGSLLLRRNRSVSVSDCYRYMDFWHIDRGGAICYCLMDLRRKDRGGASRHRLMDLYQTDLCRMDRCHMDHLCRIQLVSHRSKPLLPINVLWLRCIDQGRAAPNHRPMAWSHASTEALCPTYSFALVESL